MNKHTPGPWDYWSGYNPYDKVEAQVTAEGGDVVIASYNHLIEQGEANAKLMAAAPELFECQTMGAQMNTPDFLDWMADRLIHVYGESPDVDFVLSLRSRANAGRKAIAKARGES